MATDSGQDGNLLVPPQVTALKADADISRPGYLERTLSSDMREEREDLKEAAEQSLNVILDLSLDGVVRWVSPSWQEVIGTAPESVEGKPISDILLENKTSFVDAVASMKKDDSRSQIIKFSIIGGCSSRLAKRYKKLHDELNTPETEEPVEEKPEEEGQVLTLEGQGIMVYDRSTGEESHVSTL